MVLNSLAGRVGEAAASHHHREAAGAGPTLPARTGTSACGPHPPRPARAQEGLTGHLLLPLHGKRLQAEASTGTLSCCSPGSLLTQECWLVPWPLPRERVRAHELEFRMYSGDGRRYI